MDKNMEVFVNNESLDVRTTESRQPRDYYFTACVGLLGVLICLLVAFNSNCFALSEVIVKGNDLVATETIVLAARLSQRQNLLTLDCDKIAAAVKSNRNIATARVFKQYPNRLIIVVQERRPTFLIQQGQALYMVGNDFKVMGMVAKGECQLPVIKGMKVRQTQGIPVFSGSQGGILQELLKIGGGVPRLVIREIDMTRSIMTLEFRDNPGSITVLLGDSSRIKEKIAQLRAILAVNTAGDIVSVDLRIPGITTVTTSENKIP